MTNDATFPGSLGEAPSWNDPPGLGRSLIIGSIIGVVASFVGVTVGMLAAGIEWSSSIGLGLFIAFWGGLGFGTMVGGVVYAFGIEREAHETAGTGPSGDKAADRRDGIEANDSVTTGS